MRYLNRLIWSPIGFLIEFSKLLNNGSRDIENKRRFKNAIIDRGSTFTHDVQIGNNSHIFSGNTINHSKIGNYSYCNKNCLVQNAIIGNYCSIANDVLIGLGRHPLDKFSTSPVFYKKNNVLKSNNIDVKDTNFDEYKPIKIGNDVWIGARAIIMDGVTIANGAVIAAGAIVTKDIPAYAIAAGVPSKIIRYRFRDTVIQKLEESKWWEKEPKKLSLLMKELDQMTLSI